ncbi:bifunctional phosphoglucose/phosphomannose isomerase [Candidatus Woesearchaeota archaeon]|nr:bifunctional phosphoglucose/phosphomannose isomerase [Candidatus Woesearchaeota archaeon]
MDDKVLADKSNMHEILERFPKMIKEAMELGKDIKIEADIKNIFITGMGGSAYPGDLLKCYLDDIKIPVFVNKSYSLPKYVNKETLLFAVSYSGNTEETISAYREAIRKKANVVAVCSGGKLEKLAKMNKTPLVLVPKGLQPRLSTIYLSVPLLTILHNSGIIPSQENILKKTAAALKNPGIKEKAKELASKIKGKVPVIYSSQRTFCIAEKWKTDINENAKTPAFYNIFPEFNHNETNAYVNIIGEYFVVMIKDEQDHPRVKKRINIIKKLIMKKGVDIMEIAITGNDFLTRLISGFYLGLWVSYFLALEYETDPTPVEIIEDLKKELGK